jgi:hypothetical protein
VTDRLRLSIKLDGPLVEEHRLPLSELTRVTRQLRVALRGVAIVLADYGPSGQGGRVKKFLEEATDLRVVASPRPGSFVLDLEAPPDAPLSQEEIELPPAPHLAERTIRAFVEGLGQLDDETSELPEGFDRGVLRAITPFRTALREGLTSITLTTSEEKAGSVFLPSRSAHIDASKVSVVRRLIEKPLRAHALAEGMLQMVDFGSLECRIDRPPLPPVTCYFDEKDRDAVHRAVRQFVRVVGDGEFPPGGEHPSKIVVESLRVLYEALTFESREFWQDPGVQELAEGRAAVPYKLPEAAEDDPWRDDDEADALLAAIREE